MCFFLFASKFILYTLEGKRNYGFAVGDAFVALKASGEEKSINIFHMISFKTIWLHTNYVAS